MEKAIKIVKEMETRCNLELDRIASNYSLTNPSNIYDAGYRKILVQMKDREITKLNLLSELEMRLEAER